MVSSSSASGGAGLEDFLDPSAGAGFVSSLEASSSGGSSLGGDAVCVGFGGGGSVSASVGLTSNRKLNINMQTAIVLLCDTNLADFTSVIRKDCGYIFDFLV